jgi:Tfp pilus assembly protein PilX
MMKEITMKSTRHILDNEDGSLIAIVLLLMAILTAIGISASNTAITESQIARNETCYKRSFFQAEAAAIEVIQVLEDAVDLDTSPPTYLLPIGTLTTLNQQPSDADWGNAAASGHATATNDIEYLAFATGIQAGSSMALGEAQVHSYVVYGRDQDECGGDVIVGMGYTKPF